MCVAGCNLKEMSKRNQLFDLWPERPTINEVWSGDTNYKLKQAVKVEKRSKFDSLHIDHLPIILKFRKSRRSSLNSIHRTTSFQFTRWTFITF